MKDFDRVTHNPAVMGGKACIRGMRVTVNMIMGELEAGRGIDRILADFPYLEREDIVQAERTPHGWPARGRLTSQIREAAGRHESIAQVVRIAERRRHGSSTLVRCRRRDRARRDDHGIPADGGVGRADKRPGFWPFAGGLA